MNLKWSCTVLVKGTYPHSEKPFRFLPRLFCPCSILLVVIAAGASVRAQDETPPQVPQLPPAVVTTTANAPAAEAPTVQTRVGRARSLAAVGNFTAAATELEALRADATADEATRDVARLLLMGVYLKQSNYTRADGLLDESFKARASQQESSAGHLYFALAGQLINGVRSRLDRYHEFGLNPAGAELSAEAASDVDQLRTLLERVVDHAKTIQEQQQEGRAGGAQRAQGSEATALVEEASAARLALSRGPRERTRWQRELADARQRLMNPASQVAVLRRTAAPAPRPDNSRTAADARGVNPGAPANASAATANAATPNAVTTAPPASTSTQPAAPQPRNSTPETPNQKTDAVAPGDDAPPLPLGSLHDKATQRVNPGYPPSARNLRVTGVVTVHVVVNTEGVVEAVERTNGPVLLQQAAADAARRWKFRPTLVEGQPVRVSGFISFNFTL